MSFPPPFHPLPRCGVGHTRVRQTWHARIRNASGVVVIVVIFILDVVLGLGLLFNDRLGLADKLAILALAATVDDVVYRPRFDKRERLLLVNLAEENLALNCSQLAFKTVQKRTKLFFIVKLTYRGRNGAQYQKMSRLPCQPRMMYGRPSF